MNTVGSSIIMSGVSLDDFDDGVDVDSSAKKEVDEIIYISVFFSNRK